MTMLKGMQMLFVTNPAGFRFVWPDGSDVVEVFRPSDPDYAPFEAVVLTDSHTKENLNRFANESSEYGRA